LADGVAGTAAGAPTGAVCPEEGAAPAGALIALRCFLPLIPRATRVAFVFVTASALDANDNVAIMSMFRVNVVAANPKQEEVATPPQEALVDTGSELTWLPADVLNAIGIIPRRERHFATANKPTLRRTVGYALLRAEGYETNDEVVFAEPNDAVRVGVRTLEGFGVVVDNIGHRFVATTTVVATAQPRVVQRG
jgi:predicted aspartyl protease